jgi:hypothetical protein
MTNENERGFSRLASARQLFKRARYLSLVDLGDAEAVAREALAAARSAMDWLEDTDHFDEAHELLHDVGRFTRSTWGCSLSLDEKGYWRDCPADLAHIRMGMSPGMVIGASECSICGREPRDCVHIKGRVYDGKVCHRIITEIKEVLEVSFVARPAQPDARLHRVSVGSSGLKAALGPQWQAGMRVSCDKCLGECPGLTHPVG